jgi:hypothetical protein
MVVVRMQGILKNMVKTDRNNFDIPTLLSCERGNPEWEKFKIIYNILNFHALDLFLVGMIKRAGI